MNLVEERVVLNCPEKNNNLKAKCFSPPMWEGFLRVSEGPAVAGDLLKEGDTIVMGIKEK